VTGEAVAFALELFVEDVGLARDFYTRVLGFQTVREEDNGYIQLRYGAANIALNPRANLSGGGAPAVAPAVTPRQFEITLTVENVAAACQRVQGAGWPLRTPLKERPWGQTDFRVRDPDGYSVRFTTP